MELDLGSADPAQEQEQAMETGPENGLGETEAPAAAQSAPLDLGFGSSAGGEGGLGGTVEPSSDGGSEELRNKAAKEREQFYAERETKIAAKKKQALEEEGLATESTVATGWEGVVDLIELDDSKKEGRHDLSAMKSLLISLKHKGGAF